MEQKCFAFLLRASDIHVQLVRKKRKKWEGKISFLVKIIPFTKSSRVGFILKLADMNEERQNHGLSPPVNCSSFHSRFFKYLGFELVVLPKYEHNILCLGICNVQPNFTCFQFTTHS